MHFATNMQPPPLDPLRRSSVGLAAGGRTWKMRSVLKEKLAAVPDRSATEGQMVFD